MIRRRTSALYEHADVVSTQYGEFLTEWESLKGNEEELETDIGKELYWARVRELGDELRNSKHRRKR